MTEISSKRFYGRSFLSRPITTKPCLLEQGEANGGSFCKKLAKIEEGANMYRERPLVNTPKKSFFAPHDVWETFSTQSHAVVYASKCRAKINQNIHIFARELSSDGKRMYVVSTYQILWARYKKLPKHKRNFYEIIEDGEICRLYFDLEYPTKTNPKLDDVEILEIFIETVCFYLQEIFGISCNRGNIVDLDSSTSAKFSRHLIFHLPNSVFQNNIVCGNFVYYIYEMLRIKLLETNENMFCQLKAMNCNKKKILPPNNLDVEKLFVRSKDGVMSFFCDLGVYTKNRNFRMYGSTKIGKNATLVVSKENGFCGDAKKIAKARENPDELEYLFFLDSLVCFDDKIDENVKLLTFGEVNATHGQSHYNNVKVIPRRIEEGYKSSPFPKLDNFILAQINKGGVQGVIRRWIHYSSCNKMLYDLGHNRWCDNINRSHKSNHIYLIVDLKLGVFYQKCHDPDCKDFQSDARLLPTDVNPYLNDSEYLIDDFEDSSKLLCDALDIAECEDSFLREEKILMSENDYDMTESRVGLVGIESERFFTNEMLRCEKSSRINEEEKQGKKSVFDAIENWDDLDFDVENMPIASSLTIAEKETANLACCFPSCGKKVNVSNSGLHSQCFERNARLTSDSNELETFAGNNDNCFSDNFKRQNNGEHLSEIDGIDSNDDLKTQIYREIEDNIIDFQEWREPFCFDSTSFTEKVEISSNNNRSFVGGAGASFNDCRTFNNEAGKRILDSSSKSCFTSIKQNSSMQEDVDLSPARHPSSRTSSKTRNTTVLERNLSNAQSTPIPACHRETSSFVRCELSDVFLDDGVDEELLNYFENFENAVPPAL